MSLTPQQRILRAKAAAHHKWSRSDPVAGTAAARAAFLAGFEEQADPDGTLTPEERARRAEHLRKAYFAGLALKASQARSRRSELDRVAGPAPTESAP